MHDKDQSAQIETISILSLFTGLEMDGEIEG